MQNSLIGSWIEKLKSSDFKIRIIVINACVFIVFQVINFILGSDLSDYFTLDPRLADNILKPWSIASYGFVHMDFLHLVINMVFFYYTVDVYLTLFPKKKLISIYMFGMIVGGVFFLLFNTLLSHTPYQLEGASAGIIALFSFICFYRPQMLVYPFGLFPIKIIYILLILIVINFIDYMSESVNAGIFSHLGGLLTGFWLSRNTLINLSFLSIKKKKLTLTVIKNRKTLHLSTNKSEKQKRIDEILDKISRSGYNNLTQDEKDFLNKQSH